MKQDTLPSTYLSRKLSLSGDIHPNPGPKIYKSKEKPKSNILNILALSIFIICQLQMKKEEQPPKYCLHLRLHLGNTTINEIYNKYKFTKKKTKVNKNINNYHYLILLLIMSGDIEQNPGPEIKCNSCKQSSTPSKIIKCENCKNNYCCANPLTMME